MTPAFDCVRPARPASGRPVCTVAIDAEEDFDWDVPVEGTDYSTECMRNIGQLREILSAYGAVPTYLLTYPVLQDETAIRLLRSQVEKGHCAVGIQLHPWVTPPFDDARTRQSSFSGNIGEALEERKLVALKTRFIDVFGFAPTVFRAGRYGLGRNSPALLEKHGLSIDTSVAPLTNFSPEGGPDYAGFDYQPFWFGRERPVLELPLCRSVVGWGGRPFRRLYERLMLPRRSLARSALTRLRCAERITLSPEGNDARAMQRLMRGLATAGQPILALSFHSSSLVVGRNPYVRTQRDLHVFYDRLSAMLDTMASRHGFAFAALADVPGWLQPPVAA